MRIMHSARFPRRKWLSAEAGLSGRARCVFGGAVDGGPDRAALGAASTSRACAMCADRVLASGRRGTPAMHRTLLDCAHDVAEST
ncbi:hypothetical protein BD309DRAFT_949432 [Dichomitus squalens]|nr:hypothetical protein BD309DRAFT_949432 [Dichomitus squalens]